MLHRRPKIFLSGAARGLRAGAERKFATRGLSIGQRLTLIVLAVVIPMLLLSATIVWRLADSQRQASREAIMYSARSIMSAVDAERGKYVAVAQALAASPALQVADLSAFRDEAVRAMIGLPGAWVALADPHGQQVLNTRVAPGEPLPRVDPAVWAEEQRAFETRQIQFTDVVIGPVAKVPVVAPGVPVFRGAEPVYYLLIGLDAGIFRELLNAQRIPQGWFSAVADGSGNIVARSLDHERWVGKPAAAGWRAIRWQNGVFETIALEGQPVIYANAVSPLSGWATAVATEKSVLEAPTRQAIVIAGLVGLAVTLSSILLAAWVARRITVPIQALETGARALETGAQALEHGEPVSSAATGAPEVDRALHAFDTASRAIHEHAGRLRATVETAIDAIIVINEAGVIQSANPAVERVFGYRAEEVAGQNISLLMPEPHRSAHDGYAEAYLRTGTPKIIGIGREVEGQRKDGTTFPADLSVASWRMAGKCFFTGIVRDISERKQAEATLRAREILLRAAADNAAVGLVMLDRERRYTFANAAYVKMLGLPHSTEELIGKGPAEVLAPVYATQISPHLDRALAGERLTYELARPLPGARAGVTSTYVVAYDPLRANDGGVRGVIVTIFDVSERKQAEEHLRLVVRELSHRTKNMLAVVQVMAWQTFRTSLDSKDIGERFVQRIDALVCSHDLLARTGWRGVDLEDLVRGQIALFLEKPEARLAVHGPALLLTPEAAQTMGLALHELATNASEYGALSCASGRIEIDWKIDPDPLAARRLHMRWRELGGPAVKPPAQSGYGFTVFKNMIETGFGGEVAHEFAPHGFTWQLTAPIERMLAADDRKGLVDTVTIEDRGTHEE